MGRRRRRPRRRLHLESGRKRDRWRRHRRYGLTFAGRRLRWGRRRRGSGHTPRRRGPGNLPNRFVAKRRPPVPTDGGQREHRDRSGHTRNSGAASRGDVPERREDGIALDRRWRSTSRRFRTPLPSQRIEELAHGVPSRSYQSGAAYMTSAAVSVAATAPAATTAARRRNQPRAVRRSRLLTAAATISGTIFVARPE